jgi:tRNA pseudouridine synthase 10
VGKIEAKDNSVEPGSCIICKGIFKKLEPISNKVLDSLSTIEFDTFLVGASVPQGILDTEDEIRARYKIKGKEGIKSQITRTITDRVRKIPKMVDYARPDVTILISFIDDSIRITCRSIWLSARYKKTERGIPQKTALCRVCNGVGCASCEYKGLTGNSVESILTNYFLDAFQAESCNFIWIGSEDSESLVGGSGRPVYIEIVEPKKRKMIDLGFENNQAKGLAAIDLGPIILNQVEIISRRPNQIPHFRLSCIVNLVASLDKTHTIDLTEGELEDFRDRVVQVKLTGKFRVTHRKIYSAKLWKNRSDTNYFLELECEGGIPIRKLITGENGAVSPNLSEHLKGLSIDSTRPFDLTDIRLISENHELKSNHYSARKDYGREKNVVNDVEVHEDEILMES